MPRRRMVNIERNRRENTNPPVTMKLKDCRPPSNLICFILRPRQNGRRFPDDILKLIFLNENVWISITICLKFVPKVLIGNKPALVQIMAWRLTGDKPLSEPMMVNFADAYMRHSASMS